MIWARKDLEDIETNDEKATIAKCKALGWKEAEEVEKTEEVTKVTKKSKK